MKVKNILPIVIVSFVAVAGAAFLLILIAGESSDRERQTEEKINTTASPELEEQIEKEREEQEGESGFEVSAFPGGHIEPIKPDEGDLSSVPDLQLEAIPGQAVSVGFLIEHRSALDGRSVRIRGVVVDTLLGEEACPSTGLTGACAKARLWLADTREETRNKLYDVSVLVSEEEQEEDYLTGRIVEIQGVVIGSHSAVILSKTYE